MSLCHFCNKFILVFINKMIQILLQGLVIGYIADSIKNI